MDKKFHAKTCVKKTIYLTSQVEKVQGLNNSSTSAGSFKQFCGTRNRVGIGLSNWPTKAGILEQSVGARN